MESIQIIFAIINISSLILLGIGYFKSRFTIVDLETYNSMIEIVEEYAEMKENENCGGGVGFHLYSNDEEEDVEEIEEEEKESNER